MRNKFLSIILLAIIVSTAACTAQPAATVAPTVAPTSAPEQAAATAGPIVITDALGRTVTFDKSPERIVLAGKALFMVADAIYAFPEASNRIAAMGSTSQSNGDFVSMIDENAAAKITLTGDSIGPEQIAAANPDCVILKSSNAEKLGTPLEALGVKVVYVDFETPEQYTRDFTNLGLLFQNEARAQEINQYYSDKVNAITSVTSALTDDQKPTVLVVYYKNKDNAVSFNVPPMSWIQTTEVIDAGGTPVWQDDAELGTGWTTVTVEQIAAWNPQYIFVISYFDPVGDVVSSLKADTQWSELQAVKDSKLFGFAGDVFSWDQSDPRWVLGLTWLATKIHPDLFSSVDITSEAATFYETLYGMDNEAFTSKIVPLFSGDLP
jgi:iron complex transport system substrate-binding protein